MESEKATRSMIQELTTAMDSRFSELYDLLQKSSASSPQVMEFSNPNYKKLTPKVCPSDLEPCLTYKADDSRFRNSIVGTRENMLKRVELPVFSGEDAYGWIALAERFFRIGGYSEEDKLEVVSISLCGDGDVLSWFNSEMHRKPFLSWQDFTDRLIARFSREKLRDPSQRFFNVTQTGSVSEYIHMFEDLSTQASGLSDKQMEGIFMNGLTPDMREVVNMCKPVDLAEMISCAYQMETSSLYRVVQRERQQNSKSSVHHPASKSYSSQTVPPWKMKQLQQSPALAQSRPQIKLTEAEIAEKKRLGLCFKCPEKWSRTHLCPNKSLQVLTVVNGFDMKILDQNLIDVTEDYHVEEPALLMELSLNSFLGIDSPITTKMTGLVKKNQVVVMLDSGATHNFITPEMIKRAQLKTMVNPNLEIMLGTSVSVHGTGICQNVQLLLQGLTFTAYFIVLDLGSAYIILGVQWLRTLGKRQIDWDKHEYSFMYQGKQVTLKGDPSLHTPKLSFKYLQPEFVEKKQRAALSLSNTQISPQQEPVLAPPIAAVVEKYAHVFQPPSSLPPIRGREHAINLHSGMGPISVRTYRYPHAHKEAMEKLVQEMLRDGLIRPSHSPYSSPVLLVTKKDNSWRFCVEYRALNRATVPDKYPIPMIDQLLDELHGAKLFSKLDLRSGYHQIRMEERDIEKTAFRTHDSHYEFLVMPFGLTNAPATFQALMNEVFKAFLRKFVLIFFDDILIYSSNITDHVRHLEMVLEVFVEQKLFANKKKCTFGQKRVEYLGHIISPKGVSTNPQKIKAVENWPTPRTFKELRGFLGLTGYYRRFVQHYGLLAKPLTELLKKEQFEWCTKAQVAFDELKQGMTSAPVLALPDFTQLFVVESDASGYGLGAVLMQGKHPIAYFSRGLTGKEQLKPIYEHELMAIVLAIQKWRHYLLGRRFVVRTDQQSLKYLLEQREVTLDYQRWLTRIMGYDFDIEYKVGSENKVADGLSRIVHPTTTLLMSLTIPTSLQIHDLFKEVDESEEIQKIIRKLAAGETVKPGYGVVDGRLFYNRRLVLPQNSAYIQLILQEYHDSLLGGHSGILKTMKRIQANFYWRKMRKCVQRYVSECPVCQTHKYSTLSPAGLLQPIEIPVRIWEDISMDFIEGLPKSQGFDVIFVVVDRLSKYSHFIGLKHPFTALAVAQKFVQEVIRFHGYPRSIISDRDKIFLSNFWKECFKASGTRLRFSTAFHPQSDGQTEVLNRCLETFLRCFASQHPKAWAKYLSWAELWYNSSFHTSIQCTPFKMVYGRDPPALLSYELGSSSNFELETMLKERDAMLAEVKHHLIKAQSIMKNNADKHHRDLEFEVGTMVYLKLRPYRQHSVSRRFCQKLAARYYGPFELLARIGKVAYRLRLPPDSRIHPVFHVSQLKPVLGQGQVVNPLPPSVATLDELVVEPEELLDTRYDSEGHLEVLVQWTGLPAHENSWLRIQDLKHQFPEFALEDKLVLKKGVLIWLGGPMFVKGKSRKRQ
ncbi:unnamed protein product [Microthlaspi erraticum]|uniref:Reverse transcriptase n=1 Tax=Microthlaspi erraticum TaxID=1685480 RepID=A0A6D2HWZ1_9BRAS|nr:unnamed protein product [Microthlaspi erraticum]